MSETKINANQTTITAEDIGASSAVSTMPTAAVGYLDKIVQYVGATDATYTNGYFYKCVSDGAVTPTYSWTAVEVQASSGGLPTQTGQSGKFLTTDGTDASWSDKPLVNDSSYSGTIAIGTSSANVENGVIIGKSSTCTAPRTVVIGSNATVISKESIAIGYKAQVTAANAIQLNATYSTNTNSDANTFKVANANGNFEIMSADGTIPAARHAALPSADGTYVLKLVIADGTPTLSWVAE